MTIDRAPLIERAFDLEPSEGSYRIERIHGAVPDYIRGTYYLNGPALFGRGGQHAGHWLDGDGMVCALRFAGDGVSFTNRFVRSTKFNDEEAAGRPLYRTFGTAFEDDRLVHGIGLQSPVNISAYPAFGTLLAFGEQGLPWELDPSTLETRGEYNFGGRLNPVTPFSAHPNIDAASGELFNFGVSFSASQPCLNVYRFGAQGERIYRRRLSLDSPRSLHDFGLTERHLVFHLSPYILEMARLMDGATLMDALRWEPRLGSRLLVARREDGEAAATIDVDSSYTLHQINCFERDGLLAMDVIELERPVYDQYALPEIFPDVRRAWPARYLVDVEAGRLVERRTLEFRSMCDFPAVDTRLAARDYDEFWVLAISSSGRAGRKFFDQVVHLRWDGTEPAVYQAPPHRYLCGEPVFMADPADRRRGAIICQQLDAERLRSSFLLFDAHDVAAGPIAELELEHPVHLGFHAAFLPAAEETTDV